MNEKARQAEMSMTESEGMFADLKDSIAELLHLTKDIVSQTRFEELDNMCVDIMKKLDELESYRAIGTVSEFRELKEKATAKPKMIGYRKDGEPVYECGCCGSTLSVADQRFCMMCSCQVDWSEGKE